MLAAGEGRQWSRLGGARAPRGKRAGSPRLKPGERELRDTRPEMQGQGLEDRRRATDTRRKGDAKGARGKRRGGWEEYGTGAGAIEPGRKERNRTRTRDVRLRMTDSEWKDEISIAERRLYARR